MKNKFLLLLILGVAFFAGCNNDDDDDNALVGTWNLAPVELNDGSFVSGPIEIKWEAGEGAQLVGYVPFIEGVAGALLPQVLKDITFKKNNQIVATYSDAGISLDSDSVVEPNWKVSEAKYLKYKVVSDNQLQLYLNVENILKEVDINIDMTSMSTQLEAEDLQKLMSFVTKVSKEGVAASYVLSENLDKLTITLEKALFDQIMPLLPVFVKLIPADSDIVEIIPEVVEQLQTEWAITTAFGVSLKLEK